MPGKHQEEHVNLERWLVSYADFITLLFAFFVVMYALSLRDAKKMSAVSESMKRAFGLLAIMEDGGVSISDSMKKNIVPPIDLPRDEYYENRGSGGKRGRDPAQAEKPKTDTKLGNPEVLSKIATQKGAPGGRDLIEYRRMKRQLSKALKDAVEAGILTKEEARNAMRIREGEKGVVISLVAESFYPTAEAGLNPNMKPVLQKVGEVLKGSDKRIEIVGHTDNVPIHTAKYDSNWDLSIDRAMNLLKYFVASKEVPPARLSATGMGEFAPVATNDTPEGRAKNRRVEIVILDEAPGNVARAQGEEGQKPVEPGKSPAPSQGPPKEAPADIRIPASEKPKAAATH